MSFHIFFLLLSVFTLFLFTYKNMLSKWNLHHERSMNCVMIRNFWVKTVSIKQNTFFE